ncbi:helix-turn-helix domain-containing protein [Actinocorallia populi]|uniref:helix-turn-helix domain-containing protein n=1 Tax=Actinocorallia populi TaxID=2079200 RepID=UPI000D08E46D|nr:helix-turn-helix domain-containing protein [Actinocorallia populi]
MRELVGRLTALDPQAGAAVQVIAYFDALVAQRAGLEAIVRGAAFLARCPARLVDDERRLRVRATPDGSTSDSPEPAAPHWPAEEIVPGGPARVLLERPSGPAELDRMILERAAAAARTVLERTRTRVREPAEILLDARTSENERLWAARRLGLNPDEPARAIAFPDRPPLVRPAQADVPQDRRAGVGPAVNVLDLPSSWEAARTALRLTAEGTEQDPGPRVLHAGELGPLAVLAAHIHPGAPADPDTRALDRAAASAPWMLRTLDTVAAASSLRAAATALTVHHSTLQTRLAQASRLLGWDVRTPAGRLRLHLALIARRLHRNP